MCDDHGVPSLEQPADQRPVPRMRLVRQDVVRHDGDAYVAGGADDRQQGGDVRGHDVDDDDAVSRRGLASGTPPAQRVPPAQAARATRTCGDSGVVPGSSKPARIEAGRIGRYPGNQDDLVPPGRELLAQPRGVQHDATLVGVGRPDHRQAHGQPTGRERTMRSARRARDTTSSPVTSSRTALVVT